jgi:hypothetical protein
MSALRIIPVTTAYETLYAELLASIPAGNQWHRADVIVPNSFDPTPFIIEGNVGDVVQIYLNDAFVTSITLTSQAEQVGIRLEHSKKNFIYVRSAAGSALLLVVSANYATILKGYAEDYFFNVGVKFDDAENQLNSELSLRSVEHQIDFQEYLPPTRSMRSLAGKMAVRALINESGSTRGVDDIVAAASHTTPLVVPTTVDLFTYEPSVYPVFSGAHDEGGFEFHVWTPNICVGTWAAFIKLMDNLGYDIAELQSVSDEKVSLAYLGRTESHGFDFETDACSITSLLTQDCLPIVVSVALTIEAEIAFCMWRYPFDVVVESALGRPRLDSRDVFAEVLAAGAFTLDATGAVTGIVGAAYATLAQNPYSLILVTTVGAPTTILSASLVSGTNYLVLPAGLPSGSISVRYVGALPFDSGIPLDGAEEADPLSDGWIGTPLVDRFDGGHCLDTMVPETSLYEDLECCFTSPAATLLTASLTSIDLTMPTTVTAGFSAFDVASMMAMVEDGMALDDVFDGIDPVEDGGA